MGGTKIFKSDCFINRTVAGVVQTAQSMFKLTWDFFKQLEVQGYVTEIARNNGAPATFSPKPLGTDFWDGANPFGENAWALFLFPASANRTMPYYILFQWSSSTNFGTAPGSPAVIQASTGSLNEPKLGFQMAWGINGSPANPWGGTTGSPGSDTKGSPVWINPGAGTGFVFPVSNNVGNTHATVRQNMIGYRNSAASGDMRINFVADEDNWSVDINEGNKASEDTCIGGGIYTPISAITSPTAPLFCFVTRQNSLGCLDGTNVWGTTTGNNATREGGISIRSTNSVGILSFNWDTSIEIAEYNNNFSESFPRINLGVLGVNYNLSQVGYADSGFWRISYGTLPRDVFGPSNEWIAIYSYQAPSGISPASAKLTIPWIGAHSKGSNLTRDGITSL